jgi:hypothetical protein
VVLAFTGSLRAQQPGLGRDELQLQCVVGILHDLRCGAPFIIGEADSGGGSTTFAENGIVKIIQYIVYLPGTQSQPYWFVCCSTSCAAV